MVNAFLQELKLRNPRPSPGAPTFPGLSPSDCLCIYLVCTGGVYGRSGSFKHCSKYIALIIGITSQKRQKKKQTTQAAVRSSVKLQKAGYTKPMVVTLHTTIPYRNKETKGALKLR